MHVHMCGCTLAPCPPPCTHTGQGRAGQACDVSYEDQMRAAGLVGVATVVLDAPYFSDRQPSAVRAARLDFLSLPSAAPQQCAAALLRFV